MRRLLPVLLLAALLLSDCGSGRLSAADYRSRISNINQDLTNSTAAIQSAAAPRYTVTHIRSALRRFADNVQRIGDDLVSLKPPKRAEAANALMARGAHDFAAETRATEKKLRSVSDHHRAVVLLQKDLHNPKGAQELSRAFQELHRLGFFSG
jgi:hypothetical protein